VSKGENYMKYAGIGSRETPKDILALFYKVALYLANNGFKLDVMK